MWRAAFALGLRGIGALVLLIGVFAPAAVAIVLTALSEGGPGVLTLLKGIAKWRVPIGWYMFAAGFPVAVRLLVAVAHRLTTGGWPAFGGPPWYVVLAAIPFSTPTQAGEEIGWRGYALPRLASRVGLRWGSVLLGVVWAAWHLPFFLRPGTDKSGQSFPTFLLGVAAISVAMAWLYSRTGGSLLLTMLMHSAINQTNTIVSSAVAGASDPFAFSRSPVAWLTVGMLWLFASVFLARMPGGQVST